MKLHCVLIKSHVKTMTIQNIYQELLHLKVAGMGESLLISKASLPFEASLKGCNYLRMQHHGSYMISSQHTVNCQSVRLDF